MIAVSSLNGLVHAQEVNMNSPLEMPLSNNIESYPEERIQRLIEPTSPILGTQISNFLKLESTDPNTILLSIESFFPEWRRDVLISALSYTQTLLPHLQDYCSQKLDTAHTKWTRIDNAAIPLEALAPMHEDYIQNMRNNFDIHSTSIEKTLHMEAVASANAYQAQKEDCHLVNKLKAMEAKAEKILFKRWDRLVAINHNLSAAEAAFPRLQFSINGFTQYVYGELMKVELNHLVPLLGSALAAQNEWIALQEDNSTYDKKNRMFTYITDKLLAKYDRKDILLALAYSNRNQPSLDIHYAIDPEKALVLEAFFWKFRKNRDYTMGQNKLFKSIFPNKVFKRNPGYYHYLTAALLAYEVRCHRFSGITAHFMAVFSKLGYKGSKLIAALDLPKDFVKLGKIARTMKQQGFTTGVLAGYYGGSYGKKQCRRAIRERKRERKAAWSDIDEQIEIIEEAADREIDQIKETYGKKLSDEQKDTRDEAIAKVEIDRDRQIMELEESISEFDNTWIDDGVYGRVLRKKAY